MVLLLDAPPYKYHLAAFEDQLLEALKICFFFIESTSLEARHPIDLIILQMTVKVVCFHLSRLHRFA